jgi:hypothetical protein
MHHNKTTEKFYFIIYDNEIFIKYTQNRACSNVNQNEFPNTYDGKRRENAQKTPTTLSYV